MNNGAAVVSGSMNSVSRSNALSVSVGASTNNGAKLTFSGGSTNLLQGVYVGSSSSNNTLVVNGSALTLYNFVDVGLNNSTGNLMVITNGGSVSGTNNLWVGAGASSSNTLVVTGSNSSLTVDGTTVGIYIGDGGNRNSLIISNGATMTSQGQAYIGTLTSFNTNSSTPGSNNLVLITGSNSLWTSSANIIVGDSGSGSLTVANGGTLTAPTVVLGSSNSAVGTLNYGSAGDTAVNTLNVGSINFGNGAATLNLNQSATATLSSSLSSLANGSGQVNRTAGGTTILTGNSSGFSGNVSIASSSTIQVGSGGSSGNLGSSSIADAGTLTFNLSSYLASGNAISGSGKLSQIGSGTLDLTGNNSGFTGTASIASGSTLQVGNGSGTNGYLSGSATYTNDGTLNFDLGSPVSYGGVITGTGNFVQSGPSTLSLTAAQAYTGTTTVGPASGTNSAALNLSTTGSLASTSVTVQNGGSLLLGATNQLGSSTNVTLNNGQINLGAGSSRTSQTLTSLTLTGNSSIDFSSLPGSSSFTVGSLTMNGYTLNIFDYSSGNTHLFDSAGPSDPGLTLANIDFYGGNSITSSFLGIGGFTGGNEIVPVPEPGVILSALLLLGWLLFSNRTTLMLLLKRRSATR